MSKYERSFKKKYTLKSVIYQRKSRCIKVAGAEGLEPSARGFGDQLTCYISTVSATLT